MLAQIQQAAEAIEVISHGNDHVAMWFAGAIGTIFMIERLLYILQSRGLLVSNKKKNGNPAGGHLSFITPDQWADLNSNVKILIERRQDTGDVMDLIKDVTAVIERNETALREVKEALADQRRAFKDFIHSA